VDIFSEADMELGCEPGELVGTFPTSFINKVIYRNGRKLSKDGRDYKVVLGHHWNFMSGDWYHGICNDCGWWGREVRTPETAQKWMRNHEVKCKKG
jgi:hypothetical protein